jgi:FK506-binding protein 2
MKGNRRRRPPPQQQVVQGHRRRTIRPSTTSRLVLLLVLTVVGNLLVMSSPPTTFTFQNTVNGFQQQTMLLTTTWTTRSMNRRQISLPSTPPPSSTSTFMQQRQQRNECDNDHDPGFSKNSMEGRNSIPSSSSSSSLSISRRHAGTSMLSFATTLLSCHLLSSIIPTNANAAVTDETDTFGDNWWVTPKDGIVDARDSSSSSSSSSKQQQQQQQQSMAPPSDEIRIVVSQQELQSKDGLGIELGEVEFRTNRRIYVKSVTPNSIADKLGIQPNWIFVSINGQTTERTNMEGVAIMVYRAARATTKPSSTSTSTSPDVGTAMVELTFRDPTIFRDRLRDMSTSSSSLSVDNNPTSTTKTVTTQIAPAGDTTQRRQQDGSVKFGQRITSQDDQRLSVSQLIPPKLCKRGATTDDLLEISYIGRVYETDTIFDGSAVKINGEGIAGRGNDVSMFFVLGKQPFGQFPPGWDVGLEGMCVGERRRLLIPPSLGYGSTGLPRRGIPPNATLQYDITLVSLNGLATPQ